LPRRRQEPVPQEFEIYFYDCAGGTREIDSMGFIAVLYYLLRPTGKYHVASGYNAAALLPHGPLDLSSRVFSNPRQEQAFLLPKPAASAGVGPRIPAGSFDYKAFVPRARLSSGLNSDVHLGDYKGSKICCKRLSATLAPCTLQVPQKEPYHR
jgi:hypothetical protein